MTSIAVRVLPRLAVAAVAAGALLAAGCTGIQQPQLADMASPSTAIKDCAAWFAKLDRAIVQAGVADGEAFRIPGYPYLRVNRYLASFRQQAQADPALFAAWEAKLRELDGRTRGYEIANLPAGAIAELGVADKTDALVRSEQCAGVLAKLDGGTETRKASLIERAQVPDDYTNWKRIVGLYPLVKIPFFEFAKGWQNESAGQFQQAADGVKPVDPVVRYRPAAAPVPMATVAAIFAKAKTDALGAQQFSERDAETLFAAFAPIYDVETTGDYDKTGPLRWGNGMAPEVDIARPTVYHRIAYTRYNGRTLTQLVYLIWFPERPDSGWLDTLSGKLDALFFRITLDPAGRPLVYDSIHGCGCYHMFFPTPQVKAVPPPEAREEFAFIPRDVPAIDTSQRMVLHMLSRSHYLTDIRPEPANQTAGTPYAMVDESLLRLLPAAGGTRSAYGPNGIVPGTHRGERLLVWPLGIDDPGAMRSWGRHATALVGRRHFDDADLIERRFQIPEMADGPVGSRGNGG